MKILFLAANPESTSRLNLEKEAREIQEALDISELAREFELIQKWEVRARDFRRALLRHEPDIVHFSGHGEGESGLVIVDESSGAAKAVTGEALAGLFAEFFCVQCVLLNACYAEVQAQAIVSHVDYVIGMRETIYDKAAIAFAIGFYDGLGYRRSVEEAFRLGSNAILWEYKNNSGENRAMIPVESVQVESSEKLPEHLKPILLKKAKSIVEGINNQIQRKEPLVINSNAREKYRTRIQKYLDERNLTPIAKWQLATFAKEEGISESEASSILEAELARIEQAKETYGNLLRETMAKGFNPLEPGTQQELKELQQALKLGDKQVGEIFEAILKPSTIIGLIPPLQVFKFDVVTVDKRGEEVNRKEGQAQYFREDLGNGVGLEMVYIPGGEFLMRSPDTGKELDWSKDKEKPQHKVTVQPFFMGKFQVTQAQWRAISSLPKVKVDLEPDPSRFKGDNRPIESVSWEDAVEFCRRLSKQTRKEYRLPSEAEWEYACRADTTTPFHFGEMITDKLANFGRNNNQTKPVGSFSPNAFGLYDMHGNVFEWCEDDYRDYYDDAPTDGSAWLLGNSREKVIHGGSWGDFPGSCHFAYRFYISRDNCNEGVGLRVVCVDPGHLKLNYSQENEASVQLEEVDKNDFEFQLETNSKQLGISDLKKLEGAWIDNYGHIHAYMKLIGNKLYAPYCYGKNDHLTGIYYDWKQLKSCLFVRFRWLGNNNVKGFVLLSLKSENKMEGSWYYDRDEYLIRLNRRTDYDFFSDFLNKGNPISLSRASEIVTPSWANEYFSQFC